MFFCGVSSISISFLTGDGDELVVFSTTTSIEAAKDLLVLEIIEGDTMLFVGEAGGLLTLETAGGTCVDAKVVRGCILNAPAV